MSNLVKNIASKNHVEANKDFRKNIAGKVFTKLAEKRFEIAKSLQGKAKNETD